MRKFCKEFFVPLLTIGAALVLCVGVIMIGCASPASDPKNIGVVASAPIDYGSGVFYFHHTQANFSNALSAFLKNHPDLKVSAMTGDGSGGYGCDVGYFVVFEKR
jgi:hypothetical protein